MQVAQLKLPLAPAGALINVQRHEAITPSGSVPMPLSVTGTSGVVISDPGQIAVGGIMQAPSSAIPSQSSSRESHVSGRGSTSPLQVLHIATPPLTTHDCEPSRQ